MNMKDMDAELNFDRERGLSDLLKDGSPDNLLKDDDNELLFDSNDEPP